MKMVRLFLILACVWTTAVRAEIQFIGYMTAADGARFALQDGDKISRWLRLGESFAGFKLVAHDAPRSVLTVEKDSSRLQLPLKDSHVITGEKDAIPRVGGIEIRFNGTPNMSVEEVGKLLPIHGGDLFLENSIDLGIRSLYRSGKFASIELSLKPGTYDLVVVVTPK